MSKPVVTAEQWPEVIANVERKVQAQREEIARIRAEQMQGHREAAAWLLVDAHLTEDQTWMLRAWLQCLADIHLVDDHCGALHHAANLLNPNA